MKQILTFIFTFTIISTNSMGLFDKLFTQKESVVLEKVEDWEFYFSNVNDKLASISVDLGLKKVAPQKDLKHVVWVFIKMNNPREDGLSSKEESDKLFEIEDAIVKGFSKNYNAIFVGRITTDGDREFYFYQKDTIGLEKKVEEIMSAFKDYQFQGGARLDENWIQYFDVLYPLPAQFQKIQNRKVVD